MRKSGIASSFSCRIQDPHVATLEDNLHGRISMTLYTCKAAEVDRLQDQENRM